MMDPPSPQYIEMNIPALQSWGGTEAQKNPTFKTHNKKNHLVKLKMANTK